MRLFIAREALDPHIRLVFDMILPHRTFAQRLKAFGRASIFYALWYPQQWLPVMGTSVPGGLPPELQGHWRSVHRSSKRLARTLFHKMMQYRQKLEKRQALLGRIVDIGVDLFSMSTAISRAAWMVKAASRRIRWNWPNSSAATRGAGSKSTSTTST